jgi:hypothetical protein
MNAKKFFRITFNSGYQRHETLKQTELTIIHELLHVFFAGISEVIEDTKKIVSEDLFNGFEQWADREEHKSVAKLIKIVQRLGGTNSIHSKR